MNNMNAEHETNSSTPPHPLSKVPIAIGMAQKGFCHSFISLLLKTGTRFRQGLPSLRGGGGVLLLGRYSILSLLLALSYFPFAETDSIYKLGEYYFYEHRFDSAAVFFGEA